MKLISLLCIIILLVGCSEQVPCVNHNQHEWGGWCILYNSGEGQSGFWSDSQGYHWQMRECTKCSAREESRIPKK